MYNALLLLHSWNRWIVLLCGLAAVAGAFVNIGRRSPWSRVNDRASLFFTIFADIQMVLGIALFVVGPPWFTTFMQDPGAGMANDVVRYWTIEHGFGMVVALIFAHVGRISIKRKADAAAKNRAAAVWLSLSLFFMLATVPWPFMRYARPLFR